MIKIILFLILLAILHAKMELMSEGKCGWGLRFPCWRINNTLTKLLLGKELTGYHFYMCIMFLLLFHSPLLFLRWTKQIEYLIMGSYFLYWVLEDWFWFVQSPIYGLRNFKKGRIYWHHRWFLLPVSYWFGIIIGGTLLYLGR